MGQREAAAEAARQLGIVSPELREKQLKNWRREWKIDLIAKVNPTWRDLAEDFGFESLIKKVDPGSSPG